MTAPCMELSFAPKQARRQDLAAGGAKNQEGQKNRRGGTFKILYWMYAATRGPNVKWGAQISNRGAGNHWPSRWRRPCTQTFVTEHEAGHVACAVFEVFGV